jgi:iron complex transport system ATP-binding protein
MLGIDDAWFGYDERATTIAGVTLSIAPDRIVGILGPNGSGKTTLLRLLAGTRAPRRGRVTLDDRSLAALPRAQLARRLAVVPQETQLAFDYTVLEVAMMGRYAHLGAFEIEGPRDLAVVEEALAATGTLALKDRPYATLSGGEKQRVVIAAALAQIWDFRANNEATGSRFLLLDEPTASLDLGYQLEIVSLLRMLHAGGRAGIVISTHDISLASTLCDTLVLLRDGQIVASGPTDDVLTPVNLERVYGVEAEITRHPSGQRVVVALRRTRSEAPR